MIGNKSSKGSKINSRKSSTFFNKESFISRKLRMMVIGGFAAEFSVFLQMATDNIIAGHVIGFTGLQALTLMAPFITINAFASNLFSFGSELMYSKSVGSSSDDKANKVFSLGFYMAFLLGLLLFIGMLAIEPSFIGGLGAPAEVMAKTKEYYDLYKYAMILNPLSFYIAVLVYCDGDEFLYGLSSALQVIANIILSTILGRFYGVRGLAIGTLISIGICLSVASLHMFRKSNSLCFKLYFNIVEGLSMLKYSLVNNIPTLGWAIMSAVFTRLIISIKGADYIVIVTALVCILELSEIFKSVINAMPPLVLLYARDNCADGIRKVMKLSLVMVSALAGIVTLMLLVFPQLVPLLYNISDLSLYPDILLSVRIFALIMIPFAVYGLLGAYYIAMDRLMLGMSIHISRDIVWPVALGTLLGSLFGLPLMQVGITLGIIISGLVCGLFIMLRYGRKQLPFILGDMDNKSSHHLEYIITNAQSTNHVDDIYNILIKENVGDSVATKCRMIMETINESINERNDREVYVECVVSVENAGGLKTGGVKTSGEKNGGVKGDIIRLTIRDDGIIYDAIDEIKSQASRNNSLQAVLDGVECSNYLTLSCNCNVFVAGTFLLS